MEDERNTNQSDDASRDTETFSVEVTDQRDDILVGAELPGFDKQHIDVSVSENSVTIEAERGSDAVARTVDLPDPVVPKRVDASYDDGILWVTLGKQT
ncbi:Hsp20/alpha crystallin family protein [Natrialbaceae archaeon AArc-T1-2]|uniref:Hsp20/alpha crystallin family protein n=1 Tax=Natrialbaceae archaeon AArc-T1-2 TaxID=3053904 RepID=UPI00255B29A2|nr:Hsp20/alpha crystallin family protein [Natrialbaceae archaeon AArc-T1-2]WIV66340.1 Hsp20/alpha crystallin family protein [Natrialbaceae archaeon AArc-T1-2]